MSEQKPKFDVLNLILKHSEAYDSLERMELLLEKAGELKPLPVQPVYMALKQMDESAVAELLPKFSSTQRSLFLDIDLWVKDDVDVDAFPFWLRAYNLCTDEKVKHEFVKRPQFLLYLKASFNVWTFDVEEPEYPDHDNYFLTDDMQLLFEFHDNYEAVDEIRACVRLLYSEMGVEHAYAYLFKLTSDSYLDLQEREYQQKISRLRDYGFVDYFEALEVCHPFATKEHILGQLRKKQKNLTPELGAHSKNETLHQSALIAYREKIDRLSVELDKVKDQKRLDFLHFNFMRLVGSTIAVENALKHGKMALTRIGQKSRGVLLLGYDYTVSLTKEETGKDLIPHEKSLFDHFDFIDLYKVGETLLKTELKTLKKNLASYQFEDENESFLGKFWIDFIDESFGEVPKISLFTADREVDAQHIDRLDLYQVWSDRLHILVEMLPFIRGFYETFSKLTLDGGLQDHFYLNYKIENIDFEAILLSSFANHLIGSYDREKNPESIPKLGLTIQEFKKFVSLVMNKDGQVDDSLELSKKIVAFQNTYGLSEISGFSDYLRLVLIHQLEGYDYSNLDERDFQHVGGPIILSLN